MIMTSLCSDEPSFICVYTYMHKCYVLCYFRFLMLSYDNLHCACSSSHTHRVLSMSPTQIYNAICNVYVLHVIPNILYALYIKVYKSKRYTTNLLYPILHSKKNICTYEIMRISTCTKVSINVQNSLHYILQHM